MSDEKDYIGEEEARKVAQLIRVGVITKDHLRIKADEYEKVRRSGLNGRTHWVFENCPNFDMQIIRSMLLHQSSTIFNQPGHSEEIVLTTPTQPASESNHMPGTNMETCTKPITATHRVSRSRTTYRRLARTSKSS